MSLFRWSDFAHKKKQTAAKNQRIVQKKVKLPTQMKSRKCSLCRNIVYKEIKISEKETRKLCKAHYQAFVRRNMKYFAKYEGARD